MITSTFSNGSVVLAVEGDLDLATAPRLAVMARDVVRRGQRSIVLDLSEVEFVDAVGLGALLNIKRAVVRANGRLRLVLTAPQPLRMISLQRLEWDLEIFGDLASALSVDARDLPAG